MKLEKFFALAAEKGIAETQIQIKKSSSLSFKIFHHEIDNYSVNDSQSITSCGIVDGKFGSAKTEKLDKDSFAYLVNGIIDSAKTSEKEGQASLFKGSEKYHKKNVYGKTLPLVPVEQKITLAKQIESDIFAYDKRIVEVEEVAYEESESESEFYNSFGLKLKQKANYFVVYAGAVAKVGEETKTAFGIKIGNDLATFDEKSFVKEIGDKVLAKFGGAPCDAGKYPTVIANDVFADIVGYFIESASADEVQRQSSFLIGKLNQQVASSKVTILERPLSKNVFFSYFDDEGVATYDKPIVEKGILKTYLYNQETAKKDGVVSTGNGQWHGGKIGIGFSNIVIKGSKKTFDQLIESVKFGVYITEIAGLETGMNEQSGDFSCQAQGFTIRNGKLAEPLNLITLSGNLIEMLGDVKGFDDKKELLVNSFICPDVLIKKMSIGGK